MVVHVRSKAHYWFTWNWVWSIASGEAEIYKLKKLYSQSWLKGLVKQSTALMAQLMSLGQSLENSKPYYADNVFRSNPKCQPGGGLAAKLHYYWNELARFEFLRTISPRSSAPKILLSFLLCDLWDRHYDPSGSKPLFANNHRSTS